MKNTPTLPRFIALQVITPHYHQDLAIENMEELEQLIVTFGGEIVEKSVQHRVTPNPSTYIGSGKLEWLKKTVKLLSVDVVVINGIVNAGQLFRLEKALWEVNIRIQVWDKVDLILNIFDKHATSLEAKLQIEFARIHHLGPRIYGLGATVFSRQGGGIGTRGLGETNIERERRKIKKRKTVIQQQLKALAHEREAKIMQRKTEGIRTVALVGYTSAGKTSLFNVLTKKQKETNAALFTTLDTVVGKLEDSSIPILVSDTIGFIDHLPPFLIDAFRSTLLESLEAQLILHVIDAADPKMEEKITVVHSILTNLGTQQTPILIFNKTDQVKDSQIEKIIETYKDYEFLLVSAKNHKGIAQLKNMLAQKLV